MKQSWLLCAIGLLALIGCGDSTDGPADAAGQDGTTPQEDAGEVIIIEDADVRVVQVGTGVDHFEEVTAGELMPLIQGPQGGGRWGGFHIWHAVRVRGFDHRGISLSFETRLASNQEMLASQTRRVNLVSDGTGHHIAYGIPPAFPDCCLAAGNEVVMAVSITDAAGRTGADEITVRAGVCRDTSGVDLCL